MDLHPAEEVLNTVLVRNLDSNQVAPMARLDELSPVKAPKDKDKGRCVCVFLRWPLLSFVRSWNTHLFHFCPNDV